MKAYPLAIIFTSVFFLISGTDGFFDKKNIEVNTSYAKEIKPMPMPVSIKKQEVYEIDRLKKKTDCINNKSKDLLEKLKFKKAIQNATRNRTDREAL